MKLRASLLTLAALACALLVAEKAAAAIVMIQVDELGNMVVRETGNVVTLYQNRDSTISDAGLPGAVGQVLAYDLSGIVTGLVSGDFVIHEKNDPAHSDLIRFLAKDSTFGTFTSDHDQLLFYSSDDLDGVPADNVANLLTNFVDVSANQESQGANGVVHTLWNPVSNRQTNEPGVITNGTGDGHWDFWSEGSLAASVPEPASLAIWGLLSACIVGAAALRRQERASEC
jgi:hypothetical protein